LLTVGYRKQRSGSAAHSRKSKTFWAGRSEIEVS
jgi:hypothetical protein